MKTAFIFPGQGSQFPGMGLNLYQNTSIAKKMFDEADSFLGFQISKIMFNGSAEELKQTNIAQLAIFIHSVVEAYSTDNFNPYMVAGHSVGEFSALAAIKAISFIDGLALVKVRAEAMQKACQKYPGTMAAILGADDCIIENICNDIDDVYPANYNSPDQVVISGSINGVARASEKLKGKAKKIIQLKVAGAFHTPLMQEAEEALKKQVDLTKINDLACPIYSNINANETRDIATLKENLVGQLTSPVLWKQCVTAMHKDGADEFIELGPGKVLTGLLKKII